MNKDWDGGGTFVVKHATVAGLVVEFEANEGGAPDACC
jgi:hypothetical protein